MQIPNCRYFNFGASGQILSSFVSNIGTYLAVATQGAPTGCNFVFLLSAGWSDIRDANGVTPAQIVAGITGLISSIVAACPGAVVIICTITEDENPGAIANFTNYKNTLNSSLRSGWQSIGASAILDLDNLPQLSTWNVNYYGNLLVGTSGQFNEAGHSLAASVLQTVLDPFVSAIGIVGLLELPTYPTPSQVLTSVSVGNGTVGNVVLPTAGQVQGGVAFGANGGTTGTLPAASGNVATNQGEFDGHSGSDSLGAFGEE